MKVAYVFMGFPGRRETFAGTDIRAIRVRGVEVAAWVLRTKPSEADQLLGEWGLRDLEVHWVGLCGYLSGLLLVVQRPSWAVHVLRAVLSDNWRWPLHLLKSLALLPSVLVTYAQLRASNPDVVHLFWGHYPSMVGILAARYSPGWVVTMFLGAYDMTRQYRTSVRCASVASAVFTHAEANRPTLVRQGIVDSKIHRVYRGADIAFVTAASLGPKVPGRVVSVGALVHEKGMHHVVKSFALLQRAVPSASMVVVGDGPERGRLEGLAREEGVRSLEFRGHLPHADVIREMARAEAFVFLSTKDSERLPNVAKEAIGAGCVCVLSNTPGIDELITDLWSGFVVDPLDHAAAADALARIIRGDVDTAELVRRAQERLSEAFDVTKTSKAYLNVWQSCLNLRGISQREFLANVTASRTGRERAAQGG